MLTAITLGMDIYEMAAHSKVDAIWIECVFVEGLKDNITAPNLVANFVAGKYHVKPFSIKKGPALRGRPNSVVLERAPFFCKAG